MKIKTGSRRWRLSLAFFALAALPPSPALAGDSGVSAGNTAWVLTASALVLFMT
jgi:hypothetical protein